MSPWRVVEHTADVGLEATGDTLEQATEALVEGFGQLVCPEGEIAATETIRVEIEAPGLGDVVVDLLDELNYVHQIDRFIPADGDVQLSQLGDSYRLEADVHGERYDRDVHGHLMEIKATTYHSLEVEQEPARVKVIFDV